MVARGRPGKHYVFPTHVGWTAGGGSDPVREIRREGDATVIALGYRAGVRLTEDGVAMTHWPLNEYAGSATVHLGGQGWWEAE